MRNTVPYYMLFSSICLMLSGCFEPQVPTVNGETVLTMDQYKALAKKMKENEQKDEKEQAEAKVASTDSAFVNGTALFQNRDFANAAVEFEKVVAGNAQNSKAWYMLASCYEHTGDLKKSQEAYKKSYDIQVAQGYIADVNKIR